MHLTLYVILVLTTNPTIPADLEALGNDQFTVREAASKRLQSLPAWTAAYFKYCVRKTPDAEVRIRCQRVYEQLSEKWKIELHWIFVQLYLEIREVKRTAGLREHWQKLMANAATNLSQLSPEDLKLAEAQKVCPFHPGVPLGAMGVPLEIMLKGQPVLLGSKDCIKQAEADPDKTLAKVRELKAMPKGKLPHLSMEQLQKVKQAVHSSRNKK